MIKTESGYRCLSVLKPFLCLFKLYTLFRKSTRNKNTLRFQLFPVFKNSPNSLVGHNMFIFSCFKLKTKSLEYQIPKFQFILLVQVFPPEGKSYVYGKLILNPYSLKFPRLGSSSFS